MRINLFKPGTHTDSSGTAHTFSEADVRQIAASYDPAKHQAPYVVGHPQTDAPAYGWVNRLQYAEGILSVADDEKVDPSFTQLVNDGRFNKISVRLWHPTDPGNPTPGQWYLRHIGFLGAAA
ncbi:MAG: hypothetical protein JNM52_02975, partial [Betaproteobacteria bacterium]|nr:hypothetical protein [Betaproteobacteria bacterium]